MRGQKPVQIFRELRDAVAVAPRPRAVEDPQSVPQREARAAQYIRDHRFFPVSTLTAKCRAAGLKVSGKKNELVARLALWHGLRIFDGPRTRRHRDRVAEVAENLDRFLSAHPAPGDEGRGYYPMPGPYGMADY